MVSRVLVGDAALNSVVSSIAPWTFRVILGLPHKFTQGDKRHTQIWCELHLGAWICEASTRSRAMVLVCGACMKLQPSVSNSCLELQRGCSWPLFFYSRPLFLCGILYCSSDFCCTFQVRLHRTHISWGSYQFYDILVALSMDSLFHQSTPTAQVSWSFRDWFFSLPSSKAVFANLVIWELTLTNRALTIWNWHWPVSTTSRLPWHRLVVAGECKQPIQSKLCKGSLFIL